MKCVIAVAFMLAVQAHAADKWAVVWTGSSHGPYPAGNPVAQPDLSKILAGNTAADMTMRMVVKPGLWGKRVRLRFSNVFGDKPLTLDGAFAGVHASAGALLPGTNSPIRFQGGKTSVTLQPGELLKVCADLQVVAYEYGAVDAPARVVQRIVAVRQRTGHPPLDS